MYHILDHSYGILWCMDMVHGVFGKPLDLVVPFLVGFRRCGGGAGWQILRHLRRTGVRNDQWLEVMGPCRKFVQNMEDNPNSLVRHHILHCIGKAKMESPQFWAEPLKFGCIFAWNRVLLCFMAHFRHFPLKLHDFSGRSEDVWGPKNHPPDVFLGP